MQNTNAALGEYREDTRMKTPHAAHLRDPMIHDLHSRVTKLEHSTQEDRTNIAVMLNDLSYVKQEVTNISTGINRVLWAIGLAVIAAASTFVLSGGLVIVQ